MLFKNLLTTRKIKRFNYTPIYYDADKEALKERVERAKMSWEPKEEVGLRIKEGLQRGRKERKSYNTRILLIIGFLVFMTYYFLKK